MIRPRPLLAPLLAVLIALGPLPAAHAQAFSSISSQATPAAPAPPPGQVPAPGAVPAPTPPSTTPGKPAARPFSSVSSAAEDGTAAFGSGAGPSLPGAGGDAGPDTVDRIVIEKAARRLLLLRGEEVIAAYPVRLGLNPYGHKQREGDFRTPEGNYYLSRRNPGSEFFRSLEVSYPNAEDRARARRAGVRPGGLIMIHGQPNVPRKTPDYYAANDWTDGCIAMSNVDMADVWQRTRLGLPIEIRP